MQRVSLAVPVLFALLGVFVPAQAQAQTPAAPREAAPAKKAAPKSQAKATPTKAGQDAGTIKTKAQALPPTRTQPTKRRQAPAQRQAPKAPTNSAKEALAKQAASQPAATQGSKQAKAETKGTKDTKDTQHTKATPPPTRRLAAKTSKAPKTPTKKLSTKAQGKPPKKRKTAPQEPPLPYMRDESVKVTKLSNGLESWCQPMSGTKLAYIRLSVAAGTATDPRGLAGTARFIAELLKQKLNTPSLPPKQQLPKGGNLYEVELQKEWVHIKTQVHTSKLDVSLSHMAQSTKEAPGTPTKSLREMLRRSAGRFPPASLLERIDSTLYRREMRGRQLRGSARTFKVIRTFALNSRHGSLYRGPNMKLLVVGGVDCDKSLDTIKKTFGVLPGPKKKKPKTKQSRTLTGKMMRGLRQSMRPFLPQELIQVYMLPKIKREDWLPLNVLKHITEFELERSLSQKYGNQLPLHTAIQPFTDNGYMLFILPARAGSRRPLAKLLKATLGNLRMDPHAATLKERIPTYLPRIRLKYQELMESPKERAEQLMGQLLLPSKRYPYPQAILPALKKLDGRSVRRLARMYMGQPKALSPSHPPFSLQRVILFIGTLLLVWVLLDQTFRRSRRNES